MHRFEGTGEVCDHCGTSKWNSVHFPAGGKDYRVLENESLREQLAALTEENQRLNKEIVLLKGEMTNSQLHNVYE